MIYTLGDMSGIEHIDDFIYYIPLILLFLGIVSFLITSTISIVLGTIVKFCKKFFIYLKSRKKN